MSASVHFHHTAATATREMVTEHAKREAEFFYRLLGWSFHPDTPFTDYVDLKHKQPSFDRGHARRLQARLDNCVELCERHALDWCKLFAEEFVRLAALEDVSVMTLEDVIREGWPQ